MVDLDLQILRQQFSDEYRLVPKTGGPHAFPEEWRDVSRPFDNALYVVFELQGAAEGRSARIDGPLMSLRQRSPP